MSNLLLLKNRSGTFRELITDYDYGSFQYEYERNNERSISFTAYKTTNNADIFDAIVNETIIEYEGQDYIVKNTEVKSDNSKIMIDVVAKHIYMEFQNHYVEPVTLQEGKKLDLTFRQYMGRTFENNTDGYIFVTHGDFKDISVEEFGGKNGLELIIEGAELFGYTFFADNKKIHFYDDESFYKLSGEPFIYKYNTGDMQASTSTLDLKTYIKGYGKKYETSEYKNYQPFKPKDLTYTGKFIKEGTWRTEEIGAYYDAEIDCQFGNETLIWSLKKMSKGGYVSIYLDTKLVGTYSCYSKNAVTEKITLSSNLSKGKHRLRVVFKGKNHNVDYKKSEPCMYVGTESATVFNISADLKGDDRYKAVAEHTSDNAKVFGIKKAPTVYSENATTEKALLSEIKSQLMDEPVVEISLNYYSTEPIYEYSKVRLIHRPLAFNTELKVVKLTKFHPLVQQPVEIEFSNAREDIVAIQQRLNNQIKRVSNLAKGGQLNVIGDYKINLASESVGSVLIDE
ncbi:phage tail protein [Mammaliicoccus sciuri]|uniref:prophage endopeptidase tail family protein n=1 Tax=Mammaliicoccus sciuri TaxID=1296 RepID=UPI001FB26191|nr:prophage endopeptidase tail family protein [Mammaliicoccus sciuri]MCJ0924005.1 phage tail protein [Mammaliicoccus sciuri]